MTNNSCRTTMSALRASNEFLSVQIGSHTLYMIQLIRSMLGIEEELTKEQLINDVRELRTRIIAVKYRTDMFESFRNNIQNKYPDLKNLIEMACEVHVDFLCIRTLVLRVENKIVSDPLKKLYLFFIQLIYTQPYLFIADDIEGTQYLIVKTAFQKEFLPTCIQLSFDKPTTSIETHIRLKV